MEGSKKRPCDLVLKGGIASGVVYPGALVELAKRYRFCNLGGTSAGAIAAAVAAAAEYRRQETGSDELPGMNRVAEDLSRKGFLRSMLEPAPGARPAFATLLRLRSPAKPPAPGGKPKKPGRLVSALLRVRRGIGALVALVSNYRWPAAAGALAWAGLLWLTLDTVDKVSGAGATVLVIASATLVTVALIGGAILLTLLVVGWKLVRSLRRHRYGVCTGAALSAWLHERIQDSAGREPEGPPLTFRDLEERGVQLQMMTTDLSFARPVRLPLEREESYLFAPRELRELFPGTVVDAMLRHAGAEPGPEARQTEYMPTKDLPIVVGVRMSLSFPLLLSAVRLYSQHPRKPEYMENWFSDGGISSNFPIHFFDSWFPGRPTFGLDLQNFPDEELEPNAAKVFMPAGPEDPQPPHWTGVKGVFGFLAQIADVLENWRDALQAELPGFRDRVCQVRLSKHEGGMNLDMDRDTIAALSERGREAVLEIERKFDWRRHRFTRYLTLMEMLESGLKDVNERFEGFGTDLAVGLPGLEAYPHDAAWYPAASQATTALLKQTAGWGPPPDPVGFALGDEPKPTPVMRITPPA
jgi:predicted acylesterase/phospholipase RssA